MFKNVCVYTHTNVQAVTKRPWIWRRVGEGGMWEGFEGGNGGERCNWIVTSKKNLKEAILSIFFQKFYVSDYAMRVEFTSHVGHHIPSSLFWSPPPWLLALTLHIPQRFFLQMCTLIVSPFLTQRSHSADTTLFLAVFYCVTLTVYSPTGDFRRLIWRISPSFLLVLPLSLPPSLPPSHTYTVTLYSMV